MAIDVLPGMGVPPFSLTRPCSDWCVWVLGAVLARLPVLLVFPGGSRMSRYFETINTEMK